jgi:metal-responsive CopG/Arc/MetJ family transcriptional regulator
MSTISLSLPTEQIDFMDKLMINYGFANRSEFVRSLVRLVIYKPAILQEAATFPFVIPQERSTKKILADFKATKKYSPAFLRDLKKGLRSSDYFS